MRALANMGFTDLRLVDPVDYERTRILGIAHHCEELVDSIRHYPNMDAALADVTFVVGTAAVDHPNHPLTWNVRGLATGSAGTHSPRSGRPALQPRGRTAGSGRPGPAVT